MASASSRRQRRTRAASSPHTAWEYSMRTGGVSAAGGFVLLARFIEEFEDFFQRGLVEALAALVQALLEADGRVLHLLVRFFRAADQEKVFAAGQALMSVLVVKAHAQEAEQLGFRSVRGLVLVTVVRCGHGGSVVQEERGNAVSTIRSLFSVGQLQTGSPRILKKCRLRVSAGRVPSRKRPDLRSRECR